MCGTVGWVSPHLVAHRGRLARSVDTHGRNTGYEHRTAGDWDEEDQSPPAPLQAVDYGYDSLGRFASVTSSVSSVSSVVDYDWMDGANLLEGYSTAAGSPALTVGYTYETNRNLKTGGTNAVGGIGDPAPANISTFAYTYDETARRTDRTDTFGTAPSVDNSFGYNTRDEVTSAMFGTDSYSYQFDDIGNRIMTTTEYTEHTETNAYAANQLNQYFAITNSVTSVVQPSYDLDGNLTGDGKWIYTWNGENRLVAMESSASVPLADRLRLEFKYDYMGRRFSKEVSVYDTATSDFQLSTSHVFLYDGWNLIHETATDHTQSPALPISHSYIWGLDLSLTPQGAGGGGGLLSIVEDRDGSPSRPFYVVCDANGNVTDLVDASGNSAAHYEYDAFGNQTASSENEVSL